MGRAKGSYWNKDWTTKGYKERFEKLYAQCIEHAIIPCCKYDRNRNHAGTYAKLLDLHDQLVVKGVTPLVRLRKAGGNSSVLLEQAQPEDAGELFAMSIMDPEMRVKDLADKGHLSKRMVGAVLRRMKDRHPAFTEAVKVLNTKQLIDMLNQKIAMAMDYIDDVALAKASFKDLTVGTAVMIDKMRLLQGEPTQILSIEERRTIREILPQLILEGHRRGITIDQDGD